MALFKYVVKNSQGSTITDTAEALDEKSLVSELRTKGYLILSISIEKATIKKEKKYRKKIHPEEIALFCRQLATLVSAGLPLLQGMATISEQVENPSFKKILSVITNDIESGSSLSDSLAKFPQSFGNLFVNMIKAGEASGMLDDILNRLADYLEAANALKKRIKSAMMYPIIVTALSVAITLVLIIKVIPVFADMYTGFGGKLPLPTRILMNISDFTREWFLIEIAIAVGSAIFLKNFVKTKRGRQIADQITFKLPIFGSLFKKVAVSRFSRTLGVLIKSGVPIVSCLEIVGATSGNWIIENAIENAIERIKAGESISVPLKDSKVFPPMVLKMIAVGEKTGNLEIMLEKIAGFYDEQVEATVSGLTSLIEPLLIVFLGLIIGGIVICMFLPILQMSSMIN